MRSITGWGWYWIIWAFLGFGLPEAIALVRNVKDTLSWQFWGLEKLDLSHPLDFAEWTPFHWTIGCILLLFFLWLFGHLTFGYIR